jgi:hypothetical protein
MRLSYLSPMLAFVFMGAGCSEGGGTGPGPGPGNTPSLTGRWTYTYEETGTVVVDLTLTETSNGTVSGAGTIESAGTFQVTVTGLHSHPSVSLNVPAGTCRGGFTGQFTDGNTVTGNMSSDCRRGAWVLKRQ